jgi:dethiobiotin synthetase
VRVLIVSGTDTGVGKTVVTAALAALARERGERVAVVKPAQTGVGPDEEGDLDVVRRLSGVTDLHELVRYRDALAPASAGPGVAPERVASAVARLADRDLVLVEGAGGLLVRLHPDGGTLADVAALLDAPVLVVVRAGLGTLNHTALTTEALAARGLACAGIVIGAWPTDPDLAARRNLEDLETYAGVRLRGRMPAGAGDLDPAAFLSAARENLTTEVYA